MLLILRSIGLCIKITHYEIQPFNRQRYFLPNMSFQSSISFPARIATGYRRLASFLGTADQQTAKLWQVALEVTRNPSGSLKGKKFQSYIRAYPLMSAWWLFRRGHFSLAYFCVRVIMSFYFSGLSIFRTKLRMAWAVKLRNGSLKSKQVALRS